MQLYFVYYSPIVYSDEHTILVWTLTVYLLEITYKISPDQNLLTNLIISANNILKQTKNFTQFLCILHVSRQEMTNLF